MPQIEDYLEEIEEILEEGRGNAFSGRISVDAKAIQTVLEDMRLSIPEEIQQARFLASEHREIMDRAKRDSETIVLFV